MRKSRAAFATMCTSEMGQTCDQLYVHLKSHTCIEEHVENASVVALPLISQSYSDVLRTINCLFLNFRVSF